MRARALRAARLAGLACGLFSALGILATHAPIVAQGAVPKGEWRYIGGDAGHTRYLPLDQINAGNFEKLQVAWVWRGDNFGPAVDYVFCSTPIYVDGILYTVSGQRRTVAAIDPVREKRCGRTVNRTRPCTSAACATTTGKALPTAR